MPTALIYCRISQDTTQSGLGVKRQEDECRELCEREGFDVLEVYVDNDISAYSGKRRPEFEVLCERLDGGEVDVLVAWHPDRLTRQPRELEDLIDLLDRSTTTVRTVQAGAYDLSNAASRMTARVVGAAARYESEQKSERIRSKHRQKAEAGEDAGGGSRPFGYDDDKTTLRVHEAQLVEQMAERLLAGESLRGVTRWLNDQGSRTPAGREWYPLAVRRVLMSGRIAGRRYHHGVDAAEAKWPAIIDMSAHRRLRALLTDPERRLQRGQQPKLLTGVLFCGICGERLQSRPKKTKNGPSPSYVCASDAGEQNCGGIRIQGEPLNGLITQAVVQRVDSQDFARVVASRQRASSASDAPDPDAELAAVERLRADLAEDYAAELLGREDYVRTLGALKNREDAAKALLGRQTHQERSVLPEGQLGEVWDDLELTEQRAIIAAVVESVEIAPAVRGRNFFDAARVSITWAV